ncbi:MAG: PP2C family protein-serine/threonine phosphatase, partial [Vampirovibrionales bacterium]|nr:PP2C family protein-serine/threonine phosphatase [Vampirovibrionales bacterium]
PLSKCHYNSSQLRVTGVYLPCDALGGDIYDVIQFPDGSMDVSVADVSGHGVPASFITAIYKATCYRATHTYQQPGDILQAVNQELCQLIKTGHYVTTVYCKLRPIENTPQVLLHYSGAGHPYPLLFEAQTKQIKRLNENGLPLAWLSDGQYATRSLMLNPGDKLLLFTDGVTELKSFLDELYGEPRLEALFTSLCQEDSSDQPLLDALVNALSEFADGALLPDDMSLLLVEMI